MKKSIKYLVLSATFACMQLTVWALPKEGGKSATVKKPNPNAEKGANCAPASAILNLEFNGVRALIENGGSMFQNRSTSTAAYEVPKDSKLYAIYSGALWMGGKDINGQLKLAAITFRNGNDFWPGPLSVNPGSGNYDHSVPAGDDVVRDFGAAEIAPEECLRYDKFYTIRKAEVINYTNWWNCIKGITPANECTEVESPANDVLLRIYNWPAHGDQTLGQDFYLAPFYDNESLNPANGIYDPENDGDTPWYDDILKRDDIECGVDRRISLFGDETNWWVFNDKGNIHTETNAEPIGMEIRAQAFAFATNDQINRMTFYNYELINRGTQILEETYFSQFLDCDLGFATDDYAGCDVSRGLGYTYNGDNNDETSGGQTGYGLNPPAIGADFFEGPYQDPDGIDNPGPYYVGDSLITPSVATAIAQNGIVYRGIGVGYSDGIIDNERYGMRRFTYFTGTGGAPAYSDPTTPGQYYNYMEGLWRFGEEMYYGGTGFQSGGGNPLYPSDYLFPGMSDPLNWGTAGATVPGYPNGWDESTASNPAGDRRIVQSAGPFTLKPGAVNNITVGIVYGRGNEGDLFSSVRALAKADTKAQALFDACFKILDPPVAPNLKIQELENELILTLQNTKDIEAYEEKDEVNIPDPSVDQYYRFEGYQIYQMIDGVAGVSDLTDITKARIVAQTDIKNDVKDLINFEFDEALGFSIPVKKVVASNDGIQHSYRITEDQFAQGNRTLVNHKTYYYIAVAYAFNQFKKYDPNDPIQLDGQQTPYISSRLSFSGNAITSVAGIPHNPTPEAGGTVSYVDYGSSPMVTRIDGLGNGNNFTDLTSESVTAILQNGFVPEITYTNGGSPINVKVIDPLNVVEGYFELSFRDYVTSTGNAADTASWVIYHYASDGGALIDSATSLTTIEVDNEQLVPEWGVSIQIYQTRYTGGSGSITNEFTVPIGSSIGFADSSNRWLSFVQDNDIFFPTNWIRSGTYAPTAADDNPDAGVFNPSCYPDEAGDDDKLYTKLLGGGVAPHKLVGYQCAFMPLKYYKQTTGGSGRSAAGITFAPNIDVIITSDKSKWTRCPVYELGSDAALNVGGAEPGGLRKSPSVDKNGNTDGSGTTGQGWFPGYAIDVESGARLYMAFGENSFLGADNGSDMIWNPSSRLVDNQFNPVFGGVQPIYVYGYKLATIHGGFLNTDVGAYSESANEIYNLTVQMETTNSSTAKRNLYSNLSWIFYPLLTQGESFLSSDVTMKVRTNKEYKNFTATGENGGKPKYSWNTSDIATKKDQSSDLASALDMINVVPNPYYAYSQYERSRLDTRVKITNLPETCTIRIFNVSGKLIRTFKKDSEITSQDWDLNNEQGIPVSGGVYMIHVDVPGIGTKIVKFFGGMRQVDLQGI